MNDRGTQEVHLIVPHLSAIGITFYGNFIRGVAVGFLVGFFAALAVVAVATWMLSFLMSISRTSPQGSKSKGTYDDRAKAEALQHLTALGVGSGSAELGRQPEP